MKQIRLLIVDQEERIRRGLEMRLATEADMQVVGHADTEAAALEQIRELKPDIVIIDLKASGTEGITTAGCICSSIPQCQVLIVSMQDDAATRATAIAAGAADFVGKQEGSDRLVEAIRTVARGSIGDACSTDSLAS